MGPFCLRPDADIDYARKEALDAVASLPMLLRVDPSAAKVTEEQFELTAVGSMMASSTRNLLGGLTNIAEKITGLDIDGDGDIGSPGKGVGKGAPPGKAVDGQSKPNTKSGGEKAKDKHKSPAFKVEILSDGDSKGGDGSAPAAKSSGTAEVEVREVDVKDMTVEMPEPAKKLLKLPNPKVSISTQIESLAPPIPVLFVRPCEPVGFSLQRPSPSPSFLSLRLALSLVFFPPWLTLKGDDHVGDAIRSVYHGALVGRPEVRDGGQWCSCSPRGHPQPLPQEWRWHGVGD